MSSGVSNDAPRYFSCNEVGGYTTLAVAGLACGLFALGVIIAAMGTGSQWYYSYERPDWLTDDQLHSGYEYLWPHHDNIPEEIQNAGEIQNALQYGAQVGGVALGPCIAGFILFAVGLVGRINALQKRGVQEGDAVVSRDQPLRSFWKDIGLIAGFSVAAFSSGMMTGSSMILNNGVSHVEDLIAQGRLEYPDARLVYVSHAGEWEAKHQWSWGGENFWDRLESEWLDPTKSAMSGMVPVGLFGALGGSGLAAFSYFGHGACSLISYLKEKWINKNEVQS